MVYVRLSESDTPRFGPRGRGRGVVGNASTGVTSRVGAAARQLTSSSLVMVPTSAVHDDEIGHQFHAERPDGDQTRPAGRRARRDVGALVSTRFSTRLSPLLDGLGTTWWTRRRTKVQLSGLRPTQWTALSGLLIRRFWVRIPGGARSEAPAQRALTARTRRRAG